MSRKTLFVSSLVTFACGQLLAGEAKKEPAKAPAKPATKEAAKGVVNINTATEKELALLPRIGEKTAAAIVAYRKEKGNFKTVEDIKNVKGIGDKTLELLKPHLTITGATTLKEKVGGTTKSSSKKSTDKMKEDPKKSDG
jgi:competence protein ComEA